MVDYYSFGMQMPGRLYTASGAEYRYGYQGSEKDDEVSGEGNSINYKYRMHDPRIGRFFAVDPLAPSYPFYSPYSFSGNRVIDSRELEGLEPISVHIYMFAPFDSFGGGVHGDGTDRRFGDNVNPKLQYQEKFRIGPKVILELSTAEEIYKRPFGSWSRWLDTEPEFSPANFEKFSLSSNNLSFHLYGNNMEAEAPSFGIDVLVDLGWTSGIDILTGNQVVTFSGDVIGNRFPSSELYIEDKFNNRVFMGVSGPNGENAFWGPIIQLGNGWKDMSKFSVSVIFEGDEIMGVSVGDRTYSPDEWNAHFSGLNPGSSSTGTNASSSNGVLNQFNARRGSDKERPVSNEELEHGREIINEQRE